MAAIEQVDFKRLKMKLVPRRRNDKLGVKKFSSIKEITELLYSSKATTFDLDIDGPGKNRLPKAKHFFGLV